MEYRRRTRPNPRRKQNSSAGGTGSKFLLTLILIAAVVYLLSASAAGTWIAQNVMAPIFAAFSPDTNPSSDPNATGSPGPNSIVTNTGDGTSVTGEVSLPAMSCYLLQMGVFETQTNAEEKAVELQAKGAGGYIIQEGIRYRVFAAGYTDRESAKGVCERLEQEGLDCAVHEVSALGVTFNITSTEAQKQSISDCFTALVNAQSGMLELALNFDKDNMSIVEGKSGVSGILGELSSHRQSLAAQDSSGSILTSILNCYDAYLSSLETLSGFSGENIVDFSSKMKYTQLLMTHEYIKLTETLSE